ncbi:hypothetical protein PBI_SCTP2_139 [Salicola phage SCTP-2]|nr:hypothetical protein PBI_SCTP2_139 [Salicola phage SCTP-2]
MFNDSGNLGCIGHLRINDKTNPDNPYNIVDKKNAIHPGNMVYAIAKSMVGQDSANTFAIGWFAFGDGGSEISETGSITYRPTATTNNRNELADLYQRVYQKNINNEGFNMEVSPVIYQRPIADININLILQQGEPFGQLPMDNSIEFGGNFVFDEIGLFTNTDDIDDSYMLTHIVFHPIQKSLNRVLEFDYTLRFEIL